MEIDEWAIGQRIASHRLRRGLTQEELAGLVGISLSLMKKIESGTRSVTRFSQLVLFAQAFRIRDLRDLTGVPLTLMPDGQRRHPDVDAVRAALVDPELAAAAAWNIAMILSNQGHVDEADRVVSHAIEELRPIMNDATDARLSVWGGLHLLGAAVAARQDRDNDAWRLIDIAARVAD